MTGELDRYNEMAEEANRAGCERDTLRDALMSLASEVSATLGVAEEAIRAAAGNTNLACLKRRLNEARDIIAEISK